MALDAHAGRVRAVLWQHAAGPGVLQTGHDPTAIVPASGFADALAGLRRAAGNDAVRDAGREYARLWASTFPVLMRHLRGRPETALRLFCDEVYPYLRDDARAARIARIGAGRARLLLASDVDAEYVAGLVEGFLEAAGAHGTATHEGQDRFEVRYRVVATERLRRLTLWLGVVRLPLLLTSALAATVAIAALAAAGHAGPILDALAVLAGAIGAQAGANAVHDLRSPRLSGLGETPAPRPFMIAQALVGYAAAASATAWLLWQGRWWILAFAAGGLLFSVAYAWLRDFGLGPALAGTVHGPLIFTGAGVALAAGPDAAWLLGPPALALGALAAAVVHLDDLSDRPLDEAGGKRTLAVRLPRRQQFTTLLVILALAAAAALATFVVLARTGTPSGLLGIGASAALPAVFLAVSAARTTARFADDPRRLAPARLLMLAAHVAASAALAFTFLMEATA